MEVAGSTAWSVVDVGASVDCVAGSNTGSTGSDWKTCSLAYDFSHVLRWLNAGEEA